MYGQNITDESQIANLGELSIYERCSPYPNADTAFNWLNCSYPFMHRHNYFEVLIVTEGDMKHFINGTVYTMHAGDACLVRPNDCHKMEFTPPRGNGNIQHLNFLIRESHARAVFDGYATGLGDKLISDPNILKFRISPASLNKLINSCLAIQSDNIGYDDKVLHCKILVGRILNTFLENYFPMLSTYPQWFSEFLFSLNNPKADSRIEDITKNAPYSYSRLSRIFKELMGVSIVDYVRRVKMNYAVELLKSTDMNIIEIVYELGYNSVSYFNHTFKDFFGVTPTQLRREQHSSV